MVAITSAFSNHEFQTGNSSDRILKDFTWKTLFAVNTGGDTVTLIHIVTNTPGAPIAAPSNPFTLGFPPNGKTLFVTRDPNLLIPIRVSDVMLQSPVLLDDALSALAFAFSE